MALKRVEGSREDHNDEASLVVQSEKDAFEIGVASILIRLISRYTFGESSSVKVETASNILNSIYYAIDVYNASLSKNVDCTVIEQPTTTDEMYKRGMELIEAYVEEARQLYTEIFRDKLNLPLEIYNETLMDALPAFFKTYDITFAANNTLTSMDYPLVFDDMSKEGILYIKQWLATLKIETQFCKCLEMDSVIEFLEAYGHKYGFDYKNMPINLFSVLFEQSIFSVFSGHNEVGLTITTSDFNRISFYVKGKNQQQIQNLIDLAVKQIIYKFGIINSELIEYMNRYKELFLVRVVNSHSNDNLSQMVVIDGFDPYLNKIIYTDGVSMSDKQFRNVINQVKACDKVSDKTRIVSACVHSLQDFIDLLGAGCFFDDEYIAVLGLLGDSELAILGEMVFQEELRCGVFKLLPERTSIFKQNARAEWQLNYIDFIFDLDLNRRKIVEELINEITVEVDAGKV
ncbi:MAG: DUF6179 domain-containing protein [Syntrophomonas sp.]|nr:DUF6179 domain-containing protein [Syntrophomonas sp.]